MARRRREDRKTKTEGDVFKFPDFNEKEYIKNEIEKSKSTISIVILGIAFGAISMAVFSISPINFSWPLSAITGLLGFLFFRFAYMLFRIEPSNLEKKDYAAHVFVYFFTWLAIFILLMNTPFADYTSPQIKGIRIEGMENGTWLPYNGTEMEKYRIIAEVTDNSGVEKVEIKYLNSSWKPMNYSGENLYYFELDTSPNVRDILFYIRATDVNGHTAEVIWKFH